MSELKESVKKIQDDLLETFKSYGMCEVNKSMTYNLPDYPDKCFVISFSIKDREVKPLKKEE